MARATETPAPEPPPERDDDAVQREVQELAHAERIVSTHPAQALALARASDQQHRPGYLRPERRYVIVRALLALGRVEEARREAEWLLSHGATGELAERLRNSLQ
jgi:hypothetical protein